MSEPAASLSSAAVSSAPAGTYLGPAEVREIRGSTPYVEIPDGVVARCQMALAFPHVPAVGDSLLVIAQDEACYAIGLIRSEAPIDLRFNGDVRLHAADGDLCLESDRGIELEAPEIELRTGTLRVVADTISESARELYQRIRDRFTVHAGEKTETVAGQWHARADKATLLSSEVASVNGKEVHLG